VLEYTNATRKAGLKVGFYYCNIEWANPLLPWDMKRSADRCHTIPDFVRLSSAQMIMHNVLLFSGPVPYGVEKARPYAEQVFTAVRRRLETGPDCQGTQPLWPYRS